MSALACKAEKHLRDFIDFHTPQKRALWRGEAGAKPAQEKMVQH
jgi:hypothetical protein